MGNPDEMTNEILIWNYQDAMATANLHEQGSAAERKYTAQSVECFFEIKRRGGEVLEAWRNLPIHKA